MANASPCRLLKRAANGSLGHLKLKFLEVRFYADWTMRRWLDFVQLVQRQ